MVIEGKRVRGRKGRWKKGKRAGKDGEHGGKYDG